jgi:hypothetical protein
VTPWAPEWHLASTRGIGTCISLAMVRPGVTAGMVERAPYEDHILRAQRPSLGRAGTGRDGQSR